MKRIFISLLFVALLASAPLRASAQEPGFTSEDRERLIRLEATLTTFMHQVDKRFEQMEKRFQELREDTNKRFEELREDMNKRFEQIDKRFEQIDKRFEQVNIRFEQVDKWFEEVNKRFEQLMTFLWMLVGIFTSMTVAVIGFAYWDRRTIIRKAKEETMEAIEREGRLVHLIQALRQMAKEDEKLASVLRNFGFL